MTLDVVAIFVFAIAAFWGWRSGALSQVGRIVAAVLAVVAAPWGASWVRQVLFADSEWSAPVIEAASLFGAGVLIYLSVALIGWSVVRAMRATSETLDHLDRLGGGLMGAVKGLLIVYFLLTVFVLLQVPVQRLDPSNALELRGGVALEFVEANNVLAPWQLPDLAHLHDALKVRYYAEHFERQHVLRAHSKAADVLRKRVLVDLAADQALMQAVLKDNYALTLSDPRVREVLNDEELADRLASIDWPELLDEIRSPL